MFRDYLAKAKSTGQILTSRWFTSDTPGQWVPDDYWITPTIAMELVNYMELTGDSSSVPTLESARIAGEPYLGNCGWYDDETVWGRFFMSAYFYLSGGQRGANPDNYLQNAIIVYNDLIGAWDSTCSGGIWWKRDPPSYPDNFKAMNATLGLMEIALDLHTATGKQLYLDTAQQCWNWISHSGMIDSQGMVWGGLASNCQVDPKNKPVVALQGNPLAPLWSMYRVTGDSSFLHTAARIVQGTQANMVWPDSQILMSEADAEWNQRDESWRRDHTGETPFKGIFAGFLGLLTQNLSNLPEREWRETAQQFATFLRANADAVWANFPGGIFGMNWFAPDPLYQPDSDNKINATLQYGGLALFLAAARASSAAPAPSA